MTTDDKQPLQRNHPPQKTINIFGLKLPLKATIVIIVSTTMLMVDHYYPLWRNIPTAWGGDIRRIAWEHMGIYFVVPLLTILLMGDKPSDYGFKIGNWKAGLKAVVIVWAAAVPILYFAGKTPEMVRYYRHYEQTVWQLSLTNALELFSWEFFFRGYLIFALLRVAGPSAVILQAVPLALAHIGKPPLETFSTIFGGTMFGWVAWRTDSFIYSWIIHWFIMTFTVVVALWLAV